VDRRAVMVSHLMFYLP